MYPDLCSKCFNSQLSHLSLNMYFAMKQEKKKMKNEKWHYVNYLGISDT